MNLLQHQNLKASLVQCSAFFVVKLSHPYITTGKAIALAIQTFVRKVTFLLSNTLARFVRAFILRSKHLLISWVQSPSTMILEPREKVCHCFHFICHEVMGLVAMTLAYRLLSFKPAFSLSFFPFIEVL